MPPLTIIAGLITYIILSLLTFIIVCPILRKNDEILTLRQRELRRRFEEQERDHN